MADIRMRILSSRDLNREEIDVPEWGGMVTVRELTYAERARYYRESAKQSTAQRALSDAIEARGRSMEEKLKTTSIDEPAEEMPEEAEPIDPEIVWAGTAADVEGEGRLAALLVRMGTIDPDTGIQVFEDEDVKALAGKRPEILDKLATCIATLSAMNGDSVRSAEGNSEETPSEPQPYNSASLSDPPPES